MAYSIILVTRSMPKLPPNRGNAASRPNTAVMKASLELSLGFIAIIPP